jgi:methionyl-tRNA synthetase
VDCRGNLVLRLSRYKEPLLAFYRDNPDFIRPESRRNEVLRFGEGGLKDLSVSRTSFDWAFRCRDRPGTSCTSGWTR